jgi:hypothetical protein
VLTRDEIRERYPALIRAMQHAALLSVGEAVSAIVAHKRYNGDPMCACEAVAHYCRGHTTALLVRNAKWFRDYRRAHV